MSIIIAKPAGVSFKKSKIDGEIIFSEPVAINYVYSDGQKLHYKKQNHFKSKVWEELEAIKRYSALIYVCENEDVLKLKKSTWCPVFLDKNTAIIATGELSDFCLIDKAYLKNLIITYLKPIIKKIPKFLFLPAGKWMIERLLSFEAAMIIINSKGEINIFNKSFGTDYKKLWVFDSFTNSIQYQRTPQNYGHYFY